MKPGCGCWRCVADNGKGYAWWRCLAMNIMDAVAKDLGFTYLNEPGRPTEIFWNYRRGDDG